MVCPFECPLFVGEKLTIPFYVASTEVVYIKKKNLFFCPSLQNFTGLAHPGLHSKKILKFDMNFFFQLSQQEDWVALSLRLS